MAIVIKKKGELYLAEASSVIFEGRDWKTKEPMGVDSIIEKLLSLGYHQSDIGDALYNVDPDLVGGVDEGFEQRKKEGEIKGVRLKLPQNTGH